jgi:hypothetical protein
MGGDIKIRAGRQAYEIIRSGGFNLGRIATYFGPAGGPRWLVTSGFDLTLLEEGALGRTNPVWLVGASAGAWRFAAWLQPEAKKSYAALMEAYITASYSRKDTPRTILDSLSSIVNSYIEDDGLPFALSNKRYRLAILTTRMKNLAAYENSLLQKAGFIFLFLANAVSPKLLHRFAERFVFYYGARPPDFCLQEGFKGRFSPLSEANFKSAVIASGAIPLVVSGVQDIFGAPYGIYRDGGLIDYNINQDYRVKNGGLTLFFHHQERIIPGWMDKAFKKRRPAANFLENVVMIYPSETFVKKLPDGKIPDRGDFDTFIDDPKTRIANWRKATKLAAPLGDEFLELIESNRLRETVEIL